MSESKKELWRTAIEAFEAGSHAVLELVCLRLLDQEPENFPVRMLLAHALVKMKRFADAAELLEGANPDDERTVVLWHRTAGDYYAERGDYQAAEDEYATALALVDAQTSDLVLDLVEARLNQGNAEAALRAVETFMGRFEGEVLEDCELLAYAKARALRNLGRFEDALVAAREAAVLGEDTGGFPAGEALIVELEQRLGLEDRLENTEVGVPLDAE
jgi:tetratricopeptide (TPR) repeat protein